MEHSNSKKKNKIVLTNFIMFSKSSLKIIFILTIINIIYLLYEALNKIDVNLKNFNNLLIIEIGLCLIISPFLLSRNKKETKKKSKVQYNIIKMTGHNIDQSIKNENEKKLSEISEKDKNSNMDFFIGFLTGIYLFLFSVIVGAVYLLIY